MHFLFFFAGVHLVSVDALRKPRKEFRVKELDDRHVEKLKNVLKNGYNQNYMLMAVHVDCNLADFNPTVTPKIIV